MTACDCLYEILSGEPLEMKGKDTFFERKIELVLASYAGLPPTGQL